MPRHSTIAERVIAAKDTGQEAIFFANEVTNSGTTYEFTPDAIATFLSVEKDFTSGINQGVAVADSAAVDIAGVNTKINELLASLRAAGIIAS